MKTAIRVLITVLILAFVVFAATAWLALRQPADTILPGVRVRDIDLSGLTLDEAADALTRALPTPETQGVTAQAAGQAWAITWADAGQHYDVEATARAAYTVGRDTDGKAPLLAGLRPQNITLEPVLFSADPTLVTAFLQNIATTLDTLPVNAQLALDGSTIVATPGQPGQQLDVEASAARVLRAFADGTSTVELVLTIIPPTIAVAEPALTQAQAWLAQPFTLVVDDPLVFGVDLTDNEAVAAQPLTGYRVEFTAPPERVAAWFEPRPSSDSIKLTFVGAAVRAWVEEVAPQLDENRQLVIGDTVQNVLTALYEGQHQAMARVRHPERVYVVEPGDTLSLIAYNHMIPLYQVRLANPDVDPGAIDVGQEIVIPSVDVLLPYPLVPGKRIEISLPEQTMRVFENDTQIFTLTVSTGISRTPTIPGQFQILFKEDAAFAQRWSLDMPYFMGVYEEDEGFFNGIHELPTTHYGVRLSRGVLGWPASFGCIIVDEGEAKTLFDWADIGTLVRITGYAPGTPSWQQTLADLAPLTPDEGESGP